ncbi:MAG: DUF2061 domain-containing protein [Planctomycetota bacterium]|jgi:adenylylsulfate kinase
MRKCSDAPCRSVLKAISWRVIATATTVTIVFFLTRLCGFPFHESLKLSSVAGVADIILKLILYYLHERVWGLSSLGRKEHPLSSLPVERPLEENHLNEIRNKLSELGCLGED